MPFAYINPQWREILQKEITMGLHPNDQMGWRPAQPWLASSESDPNGYAPNTPGAKLDAGKAPIWQGVMGYFPRAIIALASLSGYGANKYAWKGWESVPDGENRYGNAMGRHIAKEAIEGEWDLDAKNDPKFPGDILHATQIAWNALARLELMLRRKDSEKARQGMSPVRPDLYPVREQMDLK